MTGLSNGSSSLYGWNKIASAHLPTDNSAVSLDSEVVILMVAY